MTKKKLIILSVAAIFIQGLVMAGVYFYVNDTVYVADTDANNTKNAPDDTTSKDPAQLEKEAEAVVISDPAEASDKYEQASELYEASGNDAKAAETSANAAAAGVDMSDNEVTAAPPVSSNSQP